MQRSRFRGYIANRQLRTYGTTGENSGMVCCGDTEPREWLLLRLEGTVLLMID